MECKMKVLICSVIVLLSVAITSDGMRTTPGEYWGEKAINELTAHGQDGGDTAFIREIKVLEEIYKEEVDLKVGKFGTWGWRRAYPPSLFISRDILYQGHHGEEEKLVNDIKLNPNTMFIWRNHKSATSKEAHQGHHGEEEELVNDIKLSPNTMFIWRNLESDTSKEAHKKQDGDAVLSMKDIGQKQEGVKEVSM